MKLYREEIAFAMEMHSEGVIWKLIALVLEVRTDTLRKSIRDAKKYGRDPRPPGIRPWLGRTDMAAQEGFSGARAAAGTGAGQPETDHVDPAADTAGAEWLGDSCRAVDRRVYPCRN